MKRCAQTSAVLDIQESWDPGLGVCTRWAEASCHNNGIITILCERDPGWWFTALWDFARFRTNNWQRRYHSFHLYSERLDQRWTEAGNVNIVLKKNKSSTKTLSKKSLCSDWPRLIYSRLCCSLLCTVCSLDVLGPWSDAHVAGTCQRSWPRSWTLVVWPMVLYALDTQTVLALVHFSRKSSLNAESRGK